MSALELRDVVVDYEARGGGRVRAVAGASLTVEPGQIVGLVGESGCGKSSLARAAVGLVAPSAGTVRFEGRPVTPLKRRARARELARLQLVFQNPYSSLNPRRKVGAQIADALDVLDLVPRRRRRARVEELLDLVGLAASAAESFPHQFSGGQRQRIAIARALAADPSVLVLGNYPGVMAEAAPTRSLWSTPFHPYTEALIGAVPHPDGSGFLPEALPGEVPDPARPPSGCRFHPRCPYAFDRCPVEDPALIGVQEGRTAACWLRVDGAQQGTSRDRRDA